MLSPILAIETRDSPLVRVGVSRGAVVAPMTVTRSSERTPYDKGRTAAVATAKYFARRGYVVVIQDVHGRYRSDGEWWAFADEGERRRIARRTRANGPCAERRLSPGRTCVAHRVAGRADVIGCQLLAPRPATRSANGRRARAWTTRGLGAGHHEWGGFRCMSAFRLSSWPSTIAADIQPDRLIVL
jgi:hypothetical protein